MRMYIKDHNLTDRNNRAILERVEEYWSIDMHQREHTAIIAREHSLVEQVERVRLQANKHIDEHQRTALGQYMTPAAIARLMASMLTCDTAHVSLLDAGAGIGSLLSAVVEQLSMRSIRPESIHITAYEIDTQLKPYLEETLQRCVHAARNVGVTCSYELIQADFITDIVEQLTNPLFIAQPKSYTCAILNPPYRKIQTNSVTRKNLRRAGIETSNLYTAFLALVMQVLGPGGELVAITPRSFCNGPYFRPFRENMLQTVSLQRFHLFNTRRDTFQDDDVLQETVIFSAIKSSIQSPIVDLTTSDRPDDDIFTLRSIPFEQLVYPQDPERFIHLVTDLSGEQVAEQISRLAARLRDLDLCVSTGRVVDFRAQSFLRAMPETGCVPLIYPNHLRHGTLQWPQLQSKKPNALLQSEETNELLVPNEYYVLVKRFSAKEEQRRVVAMVYDPTDFPFSSVGFENHLNYFHANGKGLDAPLAYGLAAYLNSTVVDSYIRQFNGHTQINATDLRNLRYPSKEQLIAIGRRIHRELLPQDEIDRLIEQECRVSNTDSAIDPIQVKNDSMKQ